VPSMITRPDAEVATRKPRRRNRVRESLAF
jgi:hypothetical protein